jgi:membrane protease subunit (stomatin/prohibitin family)
MGNHIDTIFNLPAKYDELASGLKKALEEDFSHFGLGLSQLYINSITPPPEVQKAIDDKSRLGIFDDLNKLLKMKAAMAMETASQSQGQAGAGLGMGMGFMMPAMFAEAFKSSPAPQTMTPETFSCPDCRQNVSKEAKFCPHCGHQIVVFQQCSQCGKNLPPKANFCVQCGHAIEQKPQSLKCPKCGTENLPKSIFCNQCGERI